MLRPIVILTASPAGGHPCCGANRLTIGQTLRGELTPSDPQLQDGTHIDCYVLEAPAGQRLQINMTSLAFDSDLGVGGGACGQMAAVEADDDSGGGLNARIVRETTSRVGSSLQSMTAEPPGAL